MNWSNEQLKAINEENSNILVSAGAGSGKTAVLSQRVLRKVLEGIDIRRILILTFTNEAASEMKNRIRAKISEANLIEAQSHLDEAYITTFDAFALAFVKKYHYLLNISSNLKIIDSAIIDLKKGEYLTEIMDRYYDQKDPEFLKLIGDFTVRSDEKIQKAILSINNALDLKYDKITYLESYLDNYFDASTIDNFFQEYFKHLKSLSHSLESSIYYLMPKLDAKIATKVYDAYQPFFSPLNYEALHKIPVLPSVTIKCEEDITEEKENIRFLAQKIYELSRYSEAELKDQVISTKPYINTIIKIIIELDNKIMAYKKANSAFEFNDIARLAIKIVRDNPKIATEVKNTYQEIMIDEYQDTSDLQETFISLISNNNVYMVGDIKQSIYRFRNANPLNFQTKYLAYSSNNGGLKIDLTKNFRSRSEVLDNINTIFNLIMTKDIGGINYHDNQAMVYGNLAYETKNATQNYNMEILTYDENKEYKNAEIEAFIIAQDILNKLNTHYQVFDSKTKTLREVTNSDFVIILDRDSSMPIYKQIFEYFNLPLEIYHDSNLNASQDFLIIKNILKLLINLKNKEYGQSLKYLYTSIARSYLYRKSDAQIYDDLSSDLFKTDIIRTSLSLIDDIESTPLSLLLSQIIQKFNIYEHVGQVSDVSATLIRYDYLIDLAQNCESMGLTIYDFATILDKWDEQNSDLRFKEIKGIGNFIKIMNIHKSKGLEFPICYFAGFKNKFNTQDLTDFMYHSKYGILTPFFKEGKGELFIKSLIKNNYFQEEISEKIRLFYVALTRCKEKINIVMPKPTKEGYISNQIELEEGLKYRSFLDFIISIYQNLKEYEHHLDLNSLNLTHDYNLINTIPNSSINQDSIDFKEVSLTSELIIKKHASKETKNILNYSDTIKMQMGTQIHETLELNDLTKPSSNKYIKNLQKHFDFSKYNIYQEYEFVNLTEHEQTTGIIDLMLENTQEVIIIDYKLKNIEDDAYITQLNTYYNYIKNIVSKEIHLYLYSILTDELKEVNKINQPL